MNTTTIIIGAGIVGLHIASVLRNEGHEVYVLDAAPYLAEHTSGRNSGVIHSGIFYQPGSFKEQVCIEGNRLTYEWIRKLGVNHIPCGKWIVAESGQENDFEPFFEKISCLPIPKPQIFCESDVEQAEPLLRKSRAIYVPSTGVLDAAGYVKAMAVFVEQRGVQVLLNCKVTGVSESHIETTRGEIPFDFAINCAGLFSDEIAQMTGLTGYEIKPCRGDYYVINKMPLKRPVYHLPGKSTHGLGVHLTPTFDGQTLVGPNDYFIANKMDYHHASEIKNYEDSVRYYLPEYPFTLTRGFSGNRPKLFKNGIALPEFTFEKCDNWIHLLGIESPGLTSAPAIAKHVLKLI